MDEIKDRTNVRLRFIGYTNNERLERRTAVVYQDDIGLSTARARRAMDTVKAELLLKGPQAEFEGHGFVQSDDVVDNGFAGSETARVEVQIEQSGQTLAIAQVVYTNVAITDTTNGVTESIPGTFDTGCLLPNVRNAC